MEKKQIEKCKIYQYWDKRITPAISLVFDKLSQWEQNKGNAEEIAITIADFLNTKDKCDLLPSELLKQRDEAIEVCKKALSYIEGIENRVGLNGCNTPFRIKLELNKTIKSSTPKS